MVKRYYQDAADISGPEGERFDVTASVTAGDTFTEEAIFNPSKPFNLSVGGSGWVGTVRLMRSFDAGSTWLTVWTTTEPSEKLVDTIGEGVRWKLGCGESDYGSGTIPVRLSQ